MKQNALSATWILVIKKMILMYYIKDTGKKLPQIKLQRSQKRRNMGIWVIIMLLVL